VRFGVNGGGARAGALMDHSLEISHTLKENNLIFFENTLTSFENNFKDFKDLYLKSRARIWP